MYYLRKFFFICISFDRGFSGTSAVKEFTCNARDLTQFNSWVRKIHWIGYLLQYCWASLVAQLVKSQPAMRETWVQSPGCEDSLEKEKATHSSILVWRIPGLYSPSCRKKSWTHLSNFHFQVLIARV